MFALKVSENGTNSPQNPYHNFTSRKSCGIIVGYRLIGVKQKFQRAHNTFDLKVVNGKSSFFRKKSISQWVWRLSFFSIKPRISKWQEHLKLNFTYGDRPE